MNQEQQEQQQQQMVAERRPRIAKFHGSDHEYLVQSSSKENEYHYVRFKILAECDCPDYKYRNHICKHIKEIFEGVICKPNESSSRNVV